MTGENALLYRYRNAYWQHETYMRNKQRMDQPYEAHQHELAEKGAQWLYAEMERIQKSQEAYEEFLRQGGGWFMN